jgi:hypothetical protein
MNADRENDTTAHIAKQLVHVTVRNKGQMILIPFTSSLILYAPPSMAIRSHR